MRHVVMDTETDNLLHSVTKIHSLVLRDLETDEVVSCANNRPGYHSIEHGLALLSAAEIIFGHNALLYDMPVIQKLYPDFKHNARIFDTLIAARVRWAHIKSTDFELMRKGKLNGKLIGRHSLKAWGERMGIHKDDYTDWCKANGIENPWGEWNPQMQNYCERDTLVTRELVLRLKKAGYSRVSLDNEHDLALYLNEMEENGWPLDMDKATALQAKLAGKREIAGQRLRDIFGQLYWRDGGKDFTPKRDDKKRGYYAGAPMCKLKIMDFNPGSRDHIADRLIKLYGWKPETFTDGGKPELDEDTINALPYAEAKDIAEYLLIDKRLGFLSEGKQSLITHATSERPLGGKLTGLTHVHPRINSGGTVTHRASHSNPPIAGTPKVSTNKAGEHIMESPGRWGHEFRDLLYSPAGWEQVGVDMSGIELRVLAHYMGRWDDGAYAKTVLAGDPHTVNRIALGLPEEPADGRPVGGRDTMKTWFYGYLYGAGDEKLGSIQYPLLSPAKQKQMGKIGRSKFEGGLPALGYLVERLKEKVKEQGWIELIDGRRAYIRHEHAVLNTLLQGTAAVLSKHWLVGARRELITNLGPQGWNGKWAGLGWIHDETQTAAREGLGEYVGTVMVSNIEVLTEKFSFRCPLTGKAKLGHTWADTH